MVGPVGSMFLRYALAVVAVGVAWLVKVLCPALGTDTPFLLFFLAVAVAAWYGGRGPGILAIALAVFAGQYFLPLERRPARTLAQLAVFMAEGLLISWLIEAVKTARRGVAEAERTRDHLLRAVADGVTDAIYVKDLDGRYLVINPAGAALLDKTVAEVVGRSDADLFPPEATRRIAADDRRVIESGRPHTFEDVVTLGGVTRTLLTTKGVYRDGDGRVRGLFGISRDVTEHRRAERRLVARSAATRILAESATLGEAAPRLLRAVCEGLGWEVGAAWRLDRSTERLRCIDVWTAPGLAAGDFVAQTRDAAFPLGVGLPGRAWSSGEPCWVGDVARDGNFPRAGAAAREGMHGAFAFPIRLGTEVLGVFEFFSRQIRAPDPDLLQLVNVIGSQVGQFLERRRAEEALRESEEHYRAVAETAADAFVTIDEASTILFVNRAAETIFGYPRERMLGRPLTMLIPESLRSRHLEGFRRYLETGRRHIPWVGAELTGRHESGREFPIEVSFSEFRRKDRRVFTGIIRDVSERRRVEAERAALLAREREARAEAEAANRTKDEFLATLSHELRTPLNAMLGWARLLRSGQLDPATTAKGVEAIERNVHAQSQLIDDLLDVSRIISGKLRLEMRPVRSADFVEAALDTVRPTALAKGVRLEADLRADAGWVSGDPDRLQQVVWNLLSNAIKFTPKGGTVRLGLRGAGPQVEVEVRDTGAGIAPAFLPHVFERFRQADGSTTRRHGGLGLGLAIVRHLVEVHGGTVQVESAGEGLGSAFRVLLPAAAVPPGDEAGQARSSWRIPLLQGVSVLVVDDEPDAREMLATVLRQRGAAVTVAGSAGEGLGAFRQGRPQVVILGIGMPERDGYALLRDLRSAEGDNGRVPAIALTAYARSEDRERALAEGFDRHVPKPVDPGELVRLVAGLVGSRGKA